MCHTKKMEICYTVYKVIKNFKEDHMNRSFKLLALFMLACVMFTAIPFAALADTSAAETQSTYPEENGWMNTNPNAPTDYA